MKIAENAQKYLADFNKLGENIAAGEEVLKSIKGGISQISITIPGGYAGHQDFEISNSDMLIALIETELQRQKRQQKEMSEKITKFVQGAMVFGGLKGDDICTQ